jgi:threonine dehydrogenase-like Zn-dependent dehydrogenase
MSKIDIDAMTEGVRAQLEAQGMELQGLTLDDLRDAMSHPKAADEVMRAMALEATSVQVGDPAPEFDLPLLGGRNAGERIRLSSHFGRRPVALVFGSYT